MKHKHHKIPRHAGGGDELENIELLSVKEHAQAHLELYKKHGRWQDKIAWMGLSGMIDREEIIHAILVESAKSGGQEGKKTLEVWHDRIRGLTYEEIFGDEKASELRELRRKQTIGENNPMFGKKHTDEWRAQHSEGMSGSNHFNFGKPAFTKGRVWINNCLVSKMVSPGDVDALLTSGWKKGRLKK